MARHRSVVAAAGLPTAAFARAQPSARYAAVVFYGFPIFDLRPVAAKVAALYPEHGTALIAAILSNMTSTMLDAGDQVLQAQPGQLLVGRRCDTILFAGGLMSTTATGSQGHAPLADLVLG